MSLLGRVAKALLLPFMQLAYFVGGLVPRDKRLWAIGAFHGQRFADNPKWLFLHLVRSGSLGVRAVWVTRNPNVLRFCRERDLPVVKAGSLGGIWVQLRAGAYVVEQNIWDVGYWFSKGTALVNLWHGVPLKRINWRLRDPTHAVFKAQRGTWRQRLAMRWRKPWARRKPDWMIGTSDFACDLMAEAFEVPRDHVLETGYPRNDVLLMEEGFRGTGSYPEEYPRLEAWHNEGKRLVFYMPTFRDSKLGTARALPVDWQRLDALMEVHDAVLVVKLHPVDDASMPAGATFDNIHVLPKYVDPYPLLRLADVLVTEYSSVFFDFLLLDRPVVFFAYDLDEYQEKDRPFFYDYREATPGPVSTSFDELVADLERTLKDLPGETRRWASNRKAVRVRFMPAVDAGSARRLEHQLLAALEGRQGAHRSDAPKRSRAA